jgi:hypothetical protein
LGIFTNYYRTIRRRLKPGGVVWWMLMATSPETLRRGVRTFAQVFENASFCCARAWIVRGDGGTTGDRLRACSAAPPRRPSQRSCFIEIEGTPQFLAHLLMGPARSNICFLEEQQVEHG